MARTARIRDSRAMAITVPKTGAIRIARADNAMVYPIPFTIIGQ